MAFKFVNPGYPALFDTMDLGSLIGGVNDTYNPENGVYIDTRTAAGYVNIPNLSHVYITFNLYGIDMCHYGKVLEVFAGSTSIARINFYGGGCGVDVYGLNGSNARSIGLANKQFYKVLLAIELTNNNVRISMFLNGAKKIDRSYNAGILTVKKVNFFNGQSDNPVMAYISNIIISDTDCSDEHIATANVTTVDYISSVNTETLKAKMAEYVSNATITSLSVGAVDIVPETSDINAIKESVNNTDIFTKNINNQKGVIFENMAVNPLTGGNWTLSDLVSMKFKLTGVKA